MGSINKLSIRGVRAFSPEDDEQVVEFYFPCTIIVGANGCGKTTIIESLKYAVTGGFPPGARAGQSFVHDARSVSQCTVKANVKLRFTSRSGQSMVVVRSMELCQKKAKATFKQLDGVLRMLDPETGERVSLSHKCSELDKQIPQLLGVSAPILDHVIFCHQEDASWPLQEGAVLKKKFDEIFDSTRYSKALEVFRKTEKEMLSQVKDLKADLAGLKSHKYAAENFRKELAEQTEQIENVDEMKKEIATKIVETEEKMKEYTSIIAKLEDVENLIESRRNEVAQEHMIIKKQKSMLEEDLSTKHSLQELKNMVLEFDDKVSQVVEKKDSLERQVAKVKAEIDTMRNEEMRLTKQIGKFAAAKEAQEKRLRDRYQKMENIAVTYGVDLSLTQLSQNSEAISQDESTMPTDDNITVLSIPPDDMNRFQEALDKKGVELKENLKRHRESYQNEEDAIQAALTDLGGKLKAVENDRSKLADEKNEATREHTELTSQTTSRSRIAKSDIEETRRNAELAARKRDDVSNDPRKNEIPAKIRMYEQKIDTIKRQLEDDRLTLDSLRHSADSQNEISVLKEQCEKEVEGLEDALRENSYTFQKYNIEIEKGSNLRSSDDDEGSQLLVVIESIQSEVRSKYDVVNSSLVNASDEVSRIQKLLSEKKATMLSHQKTLEKHRSKLQTLSKSMTQVTEAVDALQQHEASLGLTFAVSMEAPKELLDYVDERLEILEEDAPQANAQHVARKLLKRLKKMSKILINNGPEFELKCPCCRRDLQTESEVETFAKALNELIEDPTLLKNDPEAAEAYKSAKATYQKFRKLLSNKMDDLRDFRRMTDESNDIEKEVRKLEEEVLLYEANLKDHQMKETEIRGEVDELRELVDTIRRWHDDAGRISEKRIKINQKRLDLSASVIDSSRDLRTVENDMNNLMEEKDSLTNQINRCNKEMTQLNNTITQLSIQASNLEKLAREKESKYASEQKAVERKAELLDRLKHLGEEEKKLQELIGPLKTKIRAKEMDKQRLRSVANDEEQKLQTVASQFDNDVKRLRDVIRQITAYDSSNQAEELEKLSDTISKLLSRIDERKQHLAELQPELESAKNAVLDQERHKKNIKQNIEIMEAKIRMDELDKEIAKLELDRSTIEGHETAYDFYSMAKKSKEKLQEDKARLDGRFSEIAESIRSLKRKLSTPEYKNVDEDYRVTTIKHTTTLIAADDLKKYASALDQALLRFHGVKIREINKIIRELWLLTYKGEDISNIEIVSGEDPTNRASKSYNYRVVMTKGNYQMDMRGRCSAGQRVLASIVIRLALAETFGVSCGCIALDEPTVNLDYENKRGLGIALAQIIASRSQQRNFQLILITHDEEFVVMMKTELSTLTGFSMPDKYFQVTRESAPDGKFYSKINAVDWDELV